jgi:hypothetical protein
MFGCRAKWNSQEKIVHIALHLFSLNVFLICLLKMIPTMNNLPNLNELEIISEVEENQPLKDFSLQLEYPDFKKFEVCFKNVEEKLISKIHTFSDGAIFGCVAWLTSSRILKALSKCNNVQIIVQKEDFLKPDLDSKDTEDWRMRLKHEYEQLKCRLVRFDFRKPICNLSVCGDINVEPIRCVGNYNFEKKPAFPRSHHKFLVFCKLRKNQTRIAYEPVAVWTGSFNFSLTATRSFENAVYMEADNGYHPVMNAYLNEHHQIFALSENLDWESRWTVPQYRIGT